MRAAFAQASGRADAVAHRVVHGGARFDAPARLDPAARREIAALKPLAPLHTRAALAGIAAAAPLPSVPQVACFDTAFRRRMATAAATYALPRTGGRHGASALRLSRALRRLEPRAGARVLGAERSRRLVVCHLGGGCSVTAVLDGRSVDTSMGFSPLDGVPMATRSGTLDPGLMLRLLPRRASGTTSSTRR